MIGPRDVMDPMTRSQIAYAQERAEWMWGPLLQAISGWWRRKRKAARQRACCRTAEPQGNEPRGTTDEGYRRP